MLRRFRITGAAADVRWSYHRAARLRDYILTAEGSTGTLTATVIDADAYQCAQPHLTLCIPRQTGSWTYPIRTLHVAGATLTASVDLQE